MDAVMSTDISTNAGIISLGALFHSGLGDVIHFDVNNIYHSTDDSIVLGRGLRTSLSWLCEAHPGVGDMMK